MTATHSPARVSEAAAVDAGDTVVELVGRAVCTTTGVVTAPAEQRRVRPGQAAENLRDNLRDQVTVMLLVVLFAAQVADLWTTHVALATATLQEKNPLFRALFHSIPGLADVVKLGAVAAIAVLAMSVLARPRARGALLLAAAISMVAPISNLLVVAQH